MTIKYLIAAVCLALALAGCAPGNEPSAFRQVNAQTAMELMQTEENAQIVDVRTEAEYAEGHIPGAICIPNESIGTDPVPELPDLDQTILVYCRSGRRSKQAAQKLADLGYTNVVEFGGIQDWTGPTVS